MGTYLDKTGLQRAFTKLKSIIDGKLSLSGGTMTGQIVNNSGGSSWIYDRNSAPVKSGAPSFSSYKPAISQKTNSGNWTIGSLDGSDNLIFNYSTDTNFNAGTNTTSQVYLPTNGGTVALTSQIPSVGNGTVTVTQRGTTMGTFTLNGSSNVTIPLNDTNTTYSAGAGIGLSGTTFSNSGVRSVETGSVNGTISVNTGGNSANVAVKGLGSAAYTASSAYAGSGVVTISSSQPSSSTCKVWVQI